MHLKTIITAGMEQPVWLGSPNLLQQTKNHMGKNKDMYG